MNARLHAAAAAKDMKTNKTTIIMKARIKKTGEIANIADYSRVVLESCDSWGNPLEYPLDEVEIIEERADDIDWEQRRYEIAKEMLTVIFQETKEYSSSGGISDYHDIPKLAVDYADLLIAELKKGGCNGSH